MCACAHSLALDMVQLHRLEPCNAVEHTWKQMLTRHHECMYRSRPFLPSSPPNKVDPVGIPPLPTRGQLCHPSSSERGVLHHCVQCITMLPQRHTSQKPTSISEDDEAHIEHVTEAGIIQLFQSRTAEVVLTHVRIFKRICEGTPSPLHLLMLERFLCQPFDFTTFVNILWPASAPHT
jgi:hypothetical protein